MSESTVINSQRESATRLLLRLFWTLLSTYPSAFIALGMVMLLSGLIPATELWIIRRLLDSLVEITGQGRAGIIALLPYVLVFAGIVVLGALLDVGRKLLEVSVQEKLRIRLQRQVIDKVQEVELAYFEEPVFYDSLQRANEDMSGRLLGLSGILFEVVSAAVAMSAVLVILFAGHWSLAPIVVVGSLPGVWVRTKMHKKLHWVYLRRTSQARQVWYLRELLVNRNEAKEIRLFTLLNHLQSRWRSKARALAEERRNLNIKKSWLDALGDVVSSWAYSFCLVILVWIVAGGALTVGQFGMLIRAVQQFTGLFGQVMYSASLLHEQSLYLGDLFEFLGIQTRKKVPTSKARVDLTKELILRFEQVSFCYPGSKQPALKDLNLEIRSGERLALVGENGAGKSTLVKLMMGLYQPSAGQISLAGYPLDMWNSEELSSIFSAVFQDFVKFQFSVKDNIAFGALGQSSEGQIRMAARTAGAAEYIESLPQQYDTLLGRQFGGVDLSIGQWQKLATARCLLKRSPFIILDEPTAALDPKSEAEVFNRFAEMTRDEAVVLISHRLGSARIADRILVLKEGRLIEEGTHGELMTQSGEYERLFRLQARWYE